MTLNFGPQHPAAHGVLRLVLELNGEVCVFVLSFFSFGFLNIMFGNLLDKNISSFTSNVVIYSV